MEDLQKMMAVALVYRVLVCAYEVGLNGGQLTLICLGCDLCSQSCLLLFNLWVTSDSKLFS